tara:strand:+ start:800 stop:1006 length:207 start_codon:yes stop_codon:yes gene_type:complete
MIKVSDLRRDLVDQLEALRQIDGEVQVYYSSNDLNAYSGDCLEVQYVSTDYTTPEEGVLLVSTNFERV